MAERSRRLEPLRVTAVVPGQIAMPHGPLALDALLASQVASRAGLLPPRWASDCEPVEIPIKRADGGAFHLCSHSIGELTEYDLRYINRRPVLEQFQALGPPKGRVQITTGVDKAYRLPLEVGHLVDARLDWYCVGDMASIRDLLATVVYIGKKRSVGIGHVVRWEVAHCEPWGDGFPVVRDGKPLRPLPLDWPGLVDPPLAYSTLTYPRWDHSKEELLAVPL